jgi:hypothetical protein
VPPEYVVRRLIETVPPPQVMSPQDSYDAPHDSYRSDRAPV